MSLIPSYNQNPNRSFNSRELAIVPYFLNLRGNKIHENILCIVSGVFLLSLLAQMTISLPWTPVPITGQTFGVALIALLWGKKRGTTAVLSYLFLGGVGLPIFALGKSGFSFGPTFGYLVGMLAAAYVMGALADRGWTKKFFLTYLAAFLGSIIIFSFGVFVLTFFIPRDNLLMAGVIPFLPGDIIKTLLASSIVFHIQKISKK